MPRSGLCREVKTNRRKAPQNAGLRARQRFNMRHSPEARDQSCLRKASNSSSGWKRFGAPFTGWVLAKACSFSARSASK